MGDLTRSFSLIDFNPRRLPIPTGGEVHRNLTELAKNLQVLQDHLDHPIEIHSGYLDIYAVRQIPGLSERTLQLEGKAAKFRVGDGIVPSELVYRKIEELIERGLMLQGGLSTPTIDLVHYDIRGYWLRWDSVTGANPHLFREAEQLRIAKIPLRDFMQGIYDDAMATASKRDVNAQQLATFFQEKARS